MEVGTDYKFRDDMFNPKEDGSTVPIELMLDPSGDPTRTGGRL